jgi:hypothetical protein
MYDFDAGLRTKLQVDIFLPQDLLMDDQGRLLHERLGLMPEESYNKV